MLLLDNGWVKEALPFAYTTYIVSKKEYKNTIVYHHALQKNQLSMPDYETILLPAEQGFTALENHSQEYHFESGKRQVFSFLQLNAGVYRLSWNQELESDTVEYSFYLDEKKLDTKTFSKTENPGRCQIEFESPQGYDLLQMNALAGKARLRDLTLQRIRAAVSIVSETGEITAKTKWIKEIHPEGEDGYRFVPADNHALLHFRFHSDPRAWDSIEFESEGLATNSGTVKLNLRKEDENTVDVEFPFIVREGEKKTILRLPKESKDYNFLLGFSLKFENMVPGKERKIKNIYFGRD